MEWSMVKHAFQSVHTDLMNDLDVNPVCDILYQKRVISYGQLIELTNEREDRRSRARKLVTILSDTYAAISYFVLALCDDSVRQGHLADKLITACEGYMAIDESQTASDNHVTVNHSGEDINAWYLSVIKRTLARKLRAYKSVIRSHSTEKDIFFKLKDNNSPEVLTKELVKRAESSVSNGNIEKITEIQTQVYGIVGRRLKEMDSLDRQTPTPRTMRLLYQTAEVFLEELQDIQRIRELLSNNGLLVSGLFGETEVKQLLGETEVKQLLCDTDQTQVKEC